MKHACNLTSSRHVCVCVGGGEVACQPAGWVVCLLLQCARGDANASSGSTHQSVSQCLCGCAVSKCSVTHGLYALPSPKK